MNKNITIDEKIFIPTTIEIYINNKWYIRLWRMISNPFTYLFKGKWRL